METRLFTEGTIPEWTTSEWYGSRESAPHLEQAGHRERLLDTATWIKKFKPLNVVDLGSGDGGLLSLLKDADIDCWGYDLQQSNVDHARTVRKVNVNYLDIINEFDGVKWAELAVATEMLEHLIDPHGFVRKVSEEGAPFFLASSPWHETIDNHYPYHAWVWDEEGYANLFRSNGYPDIIAHFRAGISQIIVGALG